MKNISGCGLGLRREFFDEIDFKKNSFVPDWWEITPENWIDIPVWYQDKFDQIANSMPLVAHGVSLSLGANTKPNKKYLKKLKSLLDKYDIKYYSEHISYSSFDNLQLHELLPVPLTYKMIDNLSDNIKYTEDFLGRNISVENATYYHSSGSQLSESDFINELLHKSGAKLLLDVNNVYVNSINHNYNAKKFIKSLDLDKVSYIHTAGHYYDKNVQMIIDSHGTNVNNDTWELLKYTLDKIDVSCMIERDNNIPKLQVMGKEYKKMKKIYDKRKSNERA
ncbi:MAG: DUF692 domain-containing protein [Arcobacteraceae bacterium]|nr:DUF692 domain-containing protein [Arcobacteraceae bacterium]